MRILRPAIALAFVATGFILPTTRTSTRVLAPRGSDATENRYARTAKEYYLTAEQTDFVRPGFKIKVNSVTIGADRKPVVDVNITDDLGAAGRPPRHPDAGTHLDHLRPRLVRPGHPQLHLLRDPRADEPDHGRDARPRRRPIRAASTRTSSSATSPTRSRRSSRPGSTRRRRTRSASTAGARCPPRSWTARATSTTSSSTSGRTASRSTAKWDEIQERQRLQPVPRPAGRARRHPDRT